MTQSTIKTRKQSPIYLIIISIIIIFILTIFTSDDSPSTQSPSITPSPTPNQEQIQQEIAQLSTNYCSKRNNDIRSYIIPFRNDNEWEFKLDGKNLKQGKDLSTSDCQNIVELMHERPTAYPDILAITDRKYWIGMSLVELFMSLGSPNDINTSNYGNYEQQQWIYHKDTSGISSYYLYLENKVVTSYQDF